MMTGMKYIYSQVSWKMEMLNRSSMQLKLETGTLTFIDLPGIIVKFEIEVSRLQNSLKKNDSQQNTTLQNTELGIF